MKIKLHKGDLPDGLNLGPVVAIDTDSGQVHAVEAVFEGMPPNTPSGWR